jgi:hypothetical protein
MGNKPSERENNGRLDEGGPQDGPIGGRDDKRQQSGGDAIEAGAGGEGGQRHAGGSSRDSENQQ